MSESVPRASSGVRGAAVGTLTLLLTAFVLVEVNRPVLTPQAQLAAFALFGLPLCFLIRMKPGDPWWRRGMDLLGLVSAVAGCAFVLYWSGFGPTSLGDRAGGETGLDIALGLLGLFGVLAATARVIGPALPILAGLFLLYAAVGPHLPEILFPHRGYSLARIASQGFLQSQGVFGIAMKVMFAYVFLFVVFGAVLQATGAIRFITTSARRLFLGTVGGAAKVSVVANAMMGSLSGSARRRRRHHGHGDDSPDAEHRVHRPDRGGNHGGGEFGGGARSAGDGRRRLHDARAGGSPGELPAGSAGGHPPGPPLLRGADRHGPPARPPPPGDDPDRQRVGGERRTGSPSRRGSSSEWGSSRSWWR